MRRKKRFLKIWALCMVFIIGLTGCGKDFDASGYVQAVLDLTFQGEIENALGYEENASETSLMQQYQESIDQFVAANITNEIEMSETKTTQFADLVSKIFTTMRYSVKEAKKTGKKEYEVSVEIQPSDVFVSFQQALTEDSIKMTQKIKDGEYEGESEEETAQMILNDIVNHAYELLDVAYMDTQYGDKETVILHVKSDKKKEYYIDEDDMDQLIRKILRLDEIQG
ncbi:hypothetical protein ACQRBN_10390 [Bariatricus sp. SGI.154]|uniref:hypothetical protein n=1 Tax=Bariatricus sp. SGI.154 TaxID=3420549 RepID=UPI003CFCF7A2